MTEVVKPKRARDMQRAKLYRAECEAFPKDGPHFDLDVAEQFIATVWGSPWTKRHFERARDYPPPRVKDGRGTRTARGGLFRINLPRWARTRPIILHEVAHALTRVTREQPAHGQAFAATFLALAQHFLGTAAAAQLKASFRKHHVRYRPKRRLSEAALAALRARGQQLAARRSTPTAAPPVAPPEVPVVQTRTNSRNVNGYVKAAVRAKTLRARYAAKVAALDPLLRKVRVWENAATLKRTKLRGSQMKLAERMIEERMKGVET